MNNNEKLIRTADFAKLCDVSKQTLIYYDKIDLLNPYYVDEKGHRYYHISQYDLYGVIAMLKETGTSLEEIKSYIHNKDADRFIELLEEKKEKLTQKIKRLQKVSTSIDTIKERTESGIKALSNTDKVEIKELQEEHIILGRNIKNMSRISYIESIRELEKIASKEETYMFRIGAMIEKEELVSSKGEGNITHFYIDTDKKTHESSIKPKGLYAITYYIGKFTESYKSYKRLVEYIEKNDYEIIGNSYEKVLLDLCTLEPDEHMIQIAVQVEKK